MNPYERVTRRFNYVFSLLESYRGTSHSYFTVLDIRSMVVREHGLEGWNRLILIEMLRPKDDLDRALQKLM